MPSNQTWIWVPSNFFGISLLCLHTWMIIVPSEQYPRWQLKAPSVTKVLKRGLREREREGTEVKDMLTQPWTSSAGKCTDVSCRKLLSLSRFDVDFDFPQSENLSMSTLWLSDVMVREKTNEGEKLWKRKPNVLQVAITLRKTEKN